MAQFPVASVHGRFQPLHLAHLEYILAAKSLCHFLWIGITKYQPDQLRSAGSHRDTADANPLTYHERIQLIEEALGDAGVSRIEYGFVPFPIETPEMLSNFVPISIPCLTTICEEWNREKVRRLQECGYVVHVLWEREKIVSASEIRQLISGGGNSWMDKVPSATVRAVTRLNLRSRLVQRHRNDEGDRLG